MAACDKPGRPRDEHEDFDVDQYVEEEFRDYFQVEEKAGAARRLPEQPLLPNIA